MSLRDLCDIAWAMRLEEARQDRQLAMAATLAGGGEFVDPVQALREEMSAEPVERTSSALRRALGLST